MKVVNVRIPPREESRYQIRIGNGLLDKVPAQLCSALRASGYAVVSDSSVARLYGNALAKKIRKKSAKCTVFTFRPGEQSKNLRNLERISNNILKEGFDRDSCVIALGGGVTNDLGGFIAATYMRGVSLVQAPTTLLAMVDAGIGGKVAVDLPAAKNSCGTFYQPKAVCADVSALKSLPKKELRNGVAETIKHAMIADAKFFRYLESNMKKIFMLDEKVLEHIIARCCEIKARIVERDETERAAKGIRQILNYGHTVGHAIEAATNYKVFTHGEAVAFGMRAEGLLANRIGILSEKALERQNSLLDKAGFSARFPGLSSRKLVEIMKRDKKVRGGRINMVLPRNIGTMKKLKGSAPMPVSEAEIIKTLRSMGAKK